MDDLKKSFWAIVTLLSAPAIIISILINYLRVDFFNLLPLNPKTNQKLLIILTLLFYPSIVLLIYNDSKYIIHNYVYACPLDNSVKCYELDSESDSEVGYTRLYFPNGGHINFIQCQKPVKGIVKCYAEKDEDGIWEIRPSKTVKELK